MRVVTYNCNFNKGGIEMLQHLISDDHDVICVQRFDMKHLPSLDLTGRQVHFMTSFPHRPAYLDYGYRYGLLNIWSDGISGETRDLVLGTEIAGDDRAQGNTAIRFDMDGMSVVNCLVGYPYDSHDEDGEELWTRQVRECMAEASDGRTVVVGDFHYEDGERVWQGIDLGGTENLAADIPTFRNATGHLLSLDKIFVPRSIGASRVVHAIDVTDHPSWDIHGMHWPIAAELIP